MTGIPSLVLPSCNLLLVLLHARTIKHLACRHTFQRAESDYQPEQHDRNREDRAQHFEEFAGDLLGQGTCRDSVGAQRESETPPTHVKRESGSRDTRNCEEEPHQTVSPDDQGDDD